MPMVGKLASNSTHSIRGLVKYIPDRGYFRAVPSQNGDKFVTSPPPPQSLIKSDHERDWPPCKVVFSGWQPTRTLNVRNNNNNINNTTADIYVTTFHSLIYAGSYIIPTSYYARFFFPTAIF